MQGYPRTGPVPPPRRKDAAAFPAAMNAVRRMTLSDWGAFEIVLGLVGCLQLLIGIGAAAWAVAQGLNRVLVEGFGLAAVGLLEWAVAQGLGYLRRLARSAALREIIDAY